MKRKIFSKLLMGAFFIAAVSSFVSCKDYDDDINKNASDIAALQSQLKTLNDALTSAKSEATSAHANFATTASLEALATEVKAKATATALESAIKDLEALIGGKASKEDLDKLSETISAIDPKLDEIGTALADLKTALETANSNIESQKSILDQYKQAIADNKAAIEAAATAAGNAASKTDLAKATNDIAKLKDDLSALQDAAKSLTDIADLKTKMNQASDLVNTVSVNINALTVFVNKFLSSLVFSPDFYYGGVEATEAVQAWYLPLRYTTAYNGAIPNGQGIRYGNATNTQRKFYPLSYVQWHVNPASITKDQISAVQLISDDKLYADYVDTRSAWSGPSIEAWDVNAGILSADVKVNWARLQPAVNGGTGITVMALQATTQKEGKDTLITSDYAAIAPAVVYNFRLADNAPVAGNYVAGHGCTVAPNSTRHIYTQSSTNLDGDGAIDNLYTHNLSWTGTGVNLDEIVEVHADHYLGTQASQNNVAQPVTEINITDLERYGFERRYELVDYQWQQPNGGNVTEQTSVHAWLNGHNIVAQSINATNHEQNKSSIGREPLVKVELIDKNNNDAIVAIGFIKFRIVGEQNLPITLALTEGDMYAMCDGDQVWSTWADVEGNILAKLADDGVSKASFEGGYALAGGSQNFTISQWSNWGWANIQGDVYIKSGDNWVLPAQVYNNQGLDRQQPDAARFGRIICTTYDDGISQTNVLAWDLNANELKQLLVKRNANGRYLNAANQVVANINDAAFNETLEDLTVAAKFIDLTASGARDVYATFTADIKQLKAKLNKINNYWYASNNVAAKSGFDDIHVNVDAFKEDPNAVITHFETNFTTTLENNKFTIKTDQKNGGVSMNEDMPVWKLRNLRLWNENNNNGDGTLNANLYFLPNGTTVKNIAGTNRTGEVRTGATGANYLVYPNPVNNKQLIAARLNAQGNYDGNRTQVVAVIDQTNPYDIAMFDQTVYGCDLLNAAKHDNLANSLTAKIGITLTEGDCPMPVLLENNTFIAKFLRPLNVKDNTASFEDAVAEDGKYRLTLKDKIGYDDWRDKWATWAADATAAQKQAAIDEWIDFYNNGNHPFNITVDPNGWTTTLSGGTLGVTPLKGANGVAPDIHLELLPDGNTLEYVNANATVGEFKVRIPVIVGYYWGNLYTFIDVTVAKTNRNARHK